MKRLINTTLALLLIAILAWSVYMNLRRYAPDLKYTAPFTNENISLEINQ